MATEVPQHTAYATKDGSFAIKIIDSNGSTGALSGEYKAKVSPEDAFSGPQPWTGGFGWVHSDKMGRDDVAPFPLQVQVTKRADKFRYCVTDNWTGVYQEDNSLLMSGSRSYVNSKGNVTVESLGTQTFQKVG